MKPREISCLGLESLGLGDSGTGRVASVLDRGWHAMGWNAMNWHSCNAEAKRLWSAGSSGDCWQAIVSQRLVRAVNSE
jgi:hypothetical protein